MLIVYSDLTSAGVSFQFLKVMIVVFKLFHHQCSQIHLISLSSAVRTSQRTGRGCQHVCVLFPLSNENGFTGNKVPGRESCLSHVHLQWRDALSSLRTNCSDMNEVDEVMDRCAGSDEELEDQLSPDDQLIHNSSKGPSKENRAVKECCWIPAGF